MSRLLLLCFVVIWATTAQAKSPCEARTFEHVRFTVCVYDPQTDKIRIAWRAADGARLIGFPGLKAMLGPGAKRVRFAVNAGMFRADGAPVGLYVQEGVADTALNRNKGPGNFHMLPNGVFWTDQKGRPKIETADRFAERAATPFLATQSGPMLVIDGKLHPQIQDDGPSRFVRNGVGEMPGGRAAFVISEDAVSFGKLARFFRDELRSSNALYLDGAVSSLWEPARNRMNIRAPLGPMIWVY
jgi:uncharacterized protein YigE (DUF2233 family)